MREDSAVLLLVADVKGGSWGSAAQLSASIKREMACIFIFVGWAFVRARKTDSGTESLESWISGHISG